QLLDALLPIRRVRAEVGEIALVARERGDGAMGVGVDAAVKRAGLLRAEALLEGAEGGAAGEAEDEIESAQALRREVLDRFAAIEALEGDRRVEVVEGAQDVARRDELRRGD